MPSFSGTWPRMESPAMPSRAQARPIWGESGWTNKEQTPVAARSMQVSRSVENMPWLCQVSSDTPAHSGGGPASCQPRVQNRIAERMIAMV